MIRIAAWTLALWLVRAGDCADPAAHYDAGLELLGSQATEAPARAARDFERAVHCYRLHSDAAGVAESLHGLAIALDRSGRPREARDSADLAVDAFERIGDREGLAGARDLRGGLLARAGDLAAAEQDFLAALAHRRAIGKPEAIAGSLHNLAALALERGRVKTALEGFRQSTELHRKLGNRAAEAAGLNNLGLLYVHTGRFDKGREALEHALALQQSAGEPRRRASTLNNLGFVAWHEKNWQQARRYLNRALEIYASLPSSAAKATAMGNLGLVTSELGHGAEAERLLRTAIEEARSAGAEGVEATLLGSLGRAHLTGNRLQQAISASGAAAERLRRLGDFASLASTLHDLAIAQRLEGRAEAASSTIAEAVAAVESLGARVQLAELRPYFQAPRRPIYELAVLLAMEQGDPILASIYAEQARARGLYELLQWADGHGDMARANKIEPTEIRRLLDAEAVAGKELLIYFLGQERAWAWRAGAEGLRAFDLGPAGRIESLAGEAHAALAEGHRRSQRGRIAGVLWQLAEAVLWPLGDSFPPSLVVIADGALHRIPFGLLPTREQAPLIDGHEIGYAPSLAVLHQLRTRTASRNPGPRGELAVIADPIFRSDDPRLAQGTERSGGAAAIPPSPYDHLPPLPFTAIEAEGIAAQFPPTRVHLALGADAERGLFLDGELSSYRRIHFAGHAIIDDRNPENSGLVLSTYDAEGRATEGFLDLDTLFGMRLSADLITLGACRSALGKPLIGEGLLGLTQGFFAAGAHRLLVSLWDVDDRATARLMTDFYRFLARGEHTAPSALAEAQRRMRRDPRFAAPFYWAGFVLIGDGT